MSKISDAELRAVAYHEAGHTVAAVHFGLRVLRSWIDPEATDPGRTDLANERDELEKNCIIALAGGRAECLLSPGIQTSIRAVSDEGKVLTRITEMVQSKHDEWTIADIDKQVAAITEGLAQRTMDLLSRPEKWHTVTRIAEALIARRELSSQDIADLIGQNE